MWKTVVRKISAASLLLLACQISLLLAMHLISGRLGPVGYGQLGFAMSIAICVYQFIQWGMDQLLTVQFVRADQTETRRLLGLLLRQKQMASVAVLVAAAIVAVSLRADADKLLIFLGAIDGVALSFTIPSIFDAHTRTPTWQFFAFLRHAAYLALLLFLAYFFPKRFSPVAVLAVHIICIQIEVILEQLWIQKKFGSPAWPAPTRDAMALWKNAAPMALGILAQQVLYYSGTVALRAYGRESEMGALTLSNQLTMAAASFLAAPAALIQVRLAKETNSRAFGRRAAMLTLMCACIGSIVSLMFPHVVGVLLRIAFKNFTDSVPPIVAIDAWRLAAILTGVPLSAALICRNRLRAFAICYILAFVAGVAMTALSVPREGAVGSATGIAIGALTFCILAALFVIFDSRATVKDKA